MNPARSRHLFLEPLETRIAPATLISATTVTFQDLDGDDVTLKFTQPILDNLATANTVLTFDTGTVVAANGNATGQQLRSINLAGLPGDLSGLGFSLTAKRNAVRGGDGFADLGRIDAVGIDLGAVVIGGDLGVIDAGNAAVAGSALRSLTVQSFGELGTSTGAPDLVSNLDGRVDKLTVKGHLREARILVTDSILTVPAGDGEASIGTLLIGGSIVGGTANNTGSIEAGEHIGTATIGGDIRGGGGTRSGLLSAGKSIGAVSVLGSIVGGGGETSGNLIAVTEHAGKVFIGGDLRGGSGPSSGKIDLAEETSPTRSFVLRGSLVGGSGASSGIIEIDAEVGAFQIGGDILGGSVASTGQVKFNGPSIGSITIGGSLRAGLGNFSAQVEGVFGPTGTVRIGGSIDGTGSSFGAQLNLQSVQTLTLGGSIVGGGNGAGQIDIGGALGTATIAGSILGSTGDGSGRLEFDEAVAVTIKGSVLGGSGQDSGVVESGGTLGTASIGGDLRGGSGPRSGLVESDERIRAILVGGSVFSGGGASSGAITSGDDILLVTVKGSLVGTAGRPAVIAAENGRDATGVTDLALPRITIGGQVRFGEILAGYTGFGGAIASNADAQIGVVTVGGDWVASSVAAGVERGTDGFFGTADDEKIAGGAAAVASRIGSVTIRGQALGTPDGVDAFGLVAEEIGAVKVGASSETLVAGEVDAVPLGATFDFIAREDVVGAEVILPNLAGTLDSTTVKVLSPTLATWIDVDGDLVTLKTTKPLLDITDFVFVARGAGVQVQAIDWTNDDLPANQGVSLTVTASPQDLNDDGVLDGDGSVALGYVNASTGLRIGAVKIAGDLGRLVSGELANGAVGAASIDVQSIGLFGTTTQAAGGTLITQVVGSLGKLAVRGEFLAATVTSNGTTASVKIGGSLRAGDGTGFIGAQVIKSISIGGDLVGSGSSLTGRISANSIGTVKIGGSLIGGGENSATIAVLTTMGAVTIGRDLRGGSGDGSGLIDGGRALGAVKIGGSMIGGAGEESGSILAEQSGGSIKSVKIGGDIRGGSGEESAYIHAGQKIGVVTIAGSLIGGGGPNAGDGLLSATIYAGSAIVAGSNNIAGVTIGGDVIGGTGENSASIGAAFGVLGSPSGLNIGKIAIKGSLLGGAARSAVINANDVKSITIGGNVIGLATQSGSVALSGLLSTATIGGSVVGAGAASGSISVQGLGKLTIGHDVRGGAGNFAGEIFVNLDGARSINLGGSLESGAGTGAGKIGVNSPLGALTIKGSVWGTAADPALILARGTDSQSSPLALGKLTIGGSVEHLNVLGGFLDETQPLNSDARIGKVSVGGTWRASDLAAGVRPGTDGEYATEDDLRGTFGNSPNTASAIASIVIKGRALGTVGGTDDFGFSAEQIGAVKIGAVAFGLKAGAFNDNQTLPVAESARLRASSTGDVRIHEILLSM